MGQRKLGTITTGQAPLVPITPILDAALGPDLPRRHVGLLDGMGRAEIEVRFAPRVEAPVLVSRLLDGTPIALDKASAEAAMQMKIDALEEEGCTVIVLLCREGVRSLRCRRGAWLSHADSAVASCLAALSADRQVGVLVPRPDRIASVEGIWRPPPRRPVCEAARPCGDDGADLAKAARVLRGRGAEVLFADGMCFVERHRRIASEASGLPLVLSNEVIAEMAARLV